MSLSCHWPGCPGLSLPLCNGSAVPIAMAGGMRCSAEGLATLPGACNCSSSWRLVVVIEGRPPIIIRKMSAPPIAGAPMPELVTASME